MSQQKQTVVSFRVDQHLAEILNQLPDKSAFIREAILRRFHTSCPFCQARGVLPQVIADWLTSQIPAFKTVECTCCHYQYPLDLVRGELEGAEPAVFVCPHCADHDHDH
jgi:hypothetical protein